MSATRTKTRRKQRRAAHLPPYRPDATIAVPRVQLGENEIGFCMSPDRLDDCLRPCIATLTQTPVEQIPDLRLDERLAAGEDPEKISDEGWDRLDAWLLGRGLQLILHSAVPLERDRWIGVALGTAISPAVLHAYGWAARETPFRDHCLVMSHDRVFFDPAVGVQPQPGVRLRRWEPSEIAYGISLEPKE